jgi:hypothetical protein
MSIPIDKLHEKWMEDEEYRAAYEALEPEFSLAEELITAVPASPRPKWPRGWERRSRW